MSVWDKVKKVLIGDPPSEAELASIKSKTTSDPASPSAKTDVWAIADSVEAHSPLADAADTSMYRRVRIDRGAHGWGGPLTVHPQPGRHLIYSVTGGGIHPVAQRIAELTGGTPFDGFKSKANFDEIAVAVIDCGGTARIGVYPMKGVLTVDVHGASPSGPLMKHIHEDIFVSGVAPKDITLLDD